MSEFPSSDELIRRASGVIDREAASVLALKPQLGPGLADTLKILLSCRGHVLVAGAGTSRAVAQRFAHLLSCCGTPALALNASDALHGGAGAVTSADVLYAISKGGQSAEINQCAAIARERGARIVAHTENSGSALADMADAVFCVKAEGGVDPYGMIATGSSLVNSAACDALCVLLLELRGYTREAFGRTHPGGAVGKRLASEGEGR
jgi:arabinose-5-phosphate isomerase